MGFYYDKQPPKPEKEPGGCLEALIISRAVFGVLAVPLGVLLGLILAVVVLVALFSLAWYVGLVGILAIAAGVGAYARWERRRFRNGPH